MHRSTVTRYAVIGHPISHSQSPFIHAAFARQTGAPIEYGRIDCGPDGFESTVRAFADGGAGGCNITVPFKLNAAALAKRCSARAQLAGAANILKFDRDDWYGDNTDGVGLLRDIEINAGIALVGRRILLVGAGGAAAGVLGPLLQARPAEVVLANRSADRAVQLVMRHQALARDLGVRLLEAPLERPGEGFDVVINATASSLQGSASPVPATTLARGALALDMMYGPAARPFLDWARRHGALPRDGLGMLVEQAAEAFHVWLGLRPLTAPVLRALQDHLAPQA